LVENKRVPLVSAYTGPLFSLNSLLSLYSCVNICRRDEPGHGVYGLRFVWLDFFPLRRTSYAAHAPLLSQISYKKFGTDLTAPLWTAQYLGVPPRVALALGLRPDKWPLALWRTEEEYVKPQ
jgi:hypothetical protein